MCLYSHLSTPTRRVRLSWTNDELTRWRRVTEREREILCPAGQVPLIRAADLHVEIKQRDVVQDTHTQIHTHTHSLALSVLHTGWVSFFFEADLDFGPRRAVGSFVFTHTTDQETSHARASLTHDLHARTLEQHAV